MHNWGKCILECVKTKVEGKGFDNLEPCQIEELKMWTEIAKNIVCFDKDYQIVEAMKEAENEDNMDMIEMYEDYPERRYYRGQPRSKTSGRYMSRGDGRRSNGRMGYDDMMPMDYHMSMEDYRNMSPEELRQRDRMMGRMYYTDTTGNSMGMMNNSAMRTGNVSSGQNMNEGDRPVRGYSDGYSDGMREGQMMNQRDSREGRNGRARRTYMESKEMNKNGTPQEHQTDLKNLDTYMNELGTDIKEMVHGMQADEKTVLKQKMQNIVNTL